MSAAILLVKWVVYPVSLSLRRQTRATQKIDLFSMKSLYFASGGVQSEQRLKVLEPHNLCVSSLNFIVFLSFY